MNNYEIMMNGNVKIGEYAPGFEVQTSMEKIKLKAKNTCQNKKIYNKIIVKK